MVGSLVGCSCGKLLLLMGLARHCGARSALALIAEEPRLWEDSQSMVLRPQHAPGAGAEAEQLMPLLHKISQFSTSVMMFARQMPLPT